MHDRVVNPDVKAKAEALAEAIAESKEYQAFKDAREELDQHEAAKIMLRDFQQKQARLQQKVLGGENPSEAEVQSLQQAYQLVAFNPYVRKVIEAEAAFSEMLAEVQQMLAAAVGIEVPDDDAQGGAIEGEGVGGSTSGATQSRPEDGGSSARSRLWVPGR